MMQVEIRYLKNYGLSIIVLSVVCLLTSLKPALSQEPVANDEVVATIANQLSATFGKQQADWKSVAILVVYGSKPAKLVAYIFKQDGSFTPVSLIDIPTATWSKLYEINSLSESVNPKMIEISICNGATEKFPMQISYADSIFGGINFADDASPEDSKSLAEAMKDDCLPDDEN